MSQSFSLLHPLVDGQGNFGSMDGDGAAAMRYTEAKLTPLSMEILTELRQKTVNWRPNYDGQHSEPIVLPAQLPHLLINGAEGIAVGMSTRIPPHNLREVVDACVALIDNPGLGASDLAKKVKAPDFPTGGLILNSKDELQQFYETGNGVIRMRGTWELEKDGRRYSAVITSIPYALNKATLVEKIGDLIGKKKIPQLIDIRDESTDEVRIVVDLKIGPGRDPETEMEHAMAYLCRYTPLQSTFPMNITCLVPTENPEVSEPLKANLYDVIRHWLDFRLQTVIKRFNYELSKLKERIHTLEAFAKAFDVLDEIIALIRASEGRSDAKEQMMDRFKFDEDQADAILDLKLYRLAKLEIHAIEEELNEKKSAAEKIEGILSSNTNVWNIVKEELLELRKLYGKKRLSKIGGEEAETNLADESAYIIDEKSYIIVTENGWIKRQGRFSSIDKIRLKDGDRILAIAKGSTKNTIAYFTNKGTVYVQRIAEIPSTTGYGDPLQKYFSFSDGEKLVGAIAIDPLSLPEIPESVPIEDPDHTPPYGVAITKEGRVVRFSIIAQREVTNRSGRRYMKVGGKKDSILAVYPAIGNEWVSLYTQQTRLLCFPVSEITLVRGAGKGVIAIKMDAGDMVEGFELTNDEKSGIVVQTDRGREITVHPKKYGGSRAAKGNKLLQRGSLNKWSSPLLRLDKMFNFTKENLESSSEEGSSVGTSHLPKRFRRPNPFQKKARQKLR
jgi:DNA gyrase subunit A